MSANNQLKIYKSEKEMAWVIREIDVDTRQSYSSFKNQVFIDLEEAIKAANEYMKENEVEYGLDIKL